METDLELLQQQKQDLVSRVELSTIVITVYEDKPATTQLSLDGTADEYIHFIVDGASRMQRLIDDILLYSRVSTRGLPFERVEMDKVLEEVPMKISRIVDLHADAGWRVVLKIRASHRRFD